MLDTRSIPGVAGLAFPPFRTVRARQRGYMPQTVIGTLSSTLSRRNSFCSQGLPAVRSNTTKWPSPAPQRSM